jgi:hypothetical protein
MKESIRGVGGVGLGLVLGCSMLGCSKSPEPEVVSIPRETVRGKVTYKGEPLPRGYLHFYNGSGGKCNHLGVTQAQSLGSHPDSVSMARNLL